MEKIPLCFSSHFPTERMSRALPGPAVFEIPTTAQYHCEHRSRSGSEGLGRHFSKIDLGLPHSAVASPEEGGRAVGKEREFAQRVRRARDRGFAYLLQQQREDGGFGPPERGLTDYYKVPTAFLVCGGSDSCNRLCHWIRENGMLPNGDFGPRPQEAHGYFYIYYNSWVIIGAHRQGHFDLSFRGMQFLQPFWDEESGGFYSSATERTAHTRQDLWVVSGGGQAALYTGHVAMARGVGRWMKRLMELQPNYPDQLFSVFSRAQGLHTTPDPDDELRYVLDRGAQRDQYFFHPGIAAGFLANLHEATGEMEWLDLACQYMVLAEGASEFLLATLRAGKVAWGSSLLFRLTGQKKYGELAMRVGNNLLASQSSQGFWQTEYINRNDATAEIVVWLDEIYQNLD